jgi:4-hydroxy-tetrahydrodipicolinate synthase
MADVACGHMAGKGPVLVGSSGIWDRNLDKRPDPQVFTRQAIELSQYAASVGAAGVVHTMPEAIAPKDGQTHADVILGYFDKIQASVPAPVLIYQPPGTDKAYCATPEIMARLADMPNIKGMKVSTSDAEYTFNLTYAVAGKDFGYICGCETALLAALVTGARAAIGQGATVSPQILKQVQLCYDRGDLAGAIEAQHSTNMLVTKSRNTVEFFKRYISEKGYAIKPYSRAGGDNPYAKTFSSLTEQEYTGYKTILDEELAKY